LSILVDMTEFGYQWNEGMEEWRQEHLFPKYAASGAQKLAFIVGPRYPGAVVEDGAEPAYEGTLQFPTGWFRSRERADEWLGS
jgi:hypothetical protein